MKTFGGRKLVTGVGGKAVNEAGKSDKMSCYNLVYDVKSLGDRIKSPK